MNKWFKIVNVAGQIPQIYIYGLIGNFDNIPDSVSFLDFQAQFRKIESTNKECIVRIKSDGGSVIEGLAIYDLLDNSKMKITTIVDGMAASMAAILAQVGKVRLIAKNGFLMLHQPQGTVTGEASTIRNYADTVDELNKRLQGILQQKTGLSSDEINNLMAANKDTWINAQDAVNKYHLADAILETENIFGETIDEAGITNSLNGNKANWGFMDWYKNDPVGLAALQTANPAKWNNLYKGLEASNSAKGYTPITPNTVSNIAGVVGGQPTNPPNWTYWDYAKNDPKALAVMQQNEPQKFNNLVKAVAGQAKAKGWI